MLPVSVGPVVSLTCACCGNGTVGRQWHNRDTGYGLCPKCAEWMRGARDYSKDGMRSSYGAEGVHYNVPEGEK